MKEEYLDCPFCGSKADVSYTGLDILCSNESCWLYSKNTPIRTWQSRPIEIKLSAQITYLTNIIEENIGKDKIK